jgi:RNA polymerase-interacting CarD/CdnL/TRCF family regulator|tara:strand:+ start:783 stop:974 length:192 start_codon:yes stop_codon:yes gene_type:complete
MSKNLWDKDRKVIVRQLIKEYLEEGYSIKEAKKYASEEANEVMADKMSFVENIQNEAWENEDG